VERHGCTPFDLELALASYAGDRFADLTGGPWWPRAELDSAGLPTLFAKAARLAFAAETQMC
jgi:A/G-specific adenine glycosylase